MVNLGRLLDKTFVALYFFLQFGRRSKTPTKQVGTVMRQNSGVLQCCTLFSPSKKNNKKKKKCEELLMKLLTKKTSIKVKTFKRLCRKPTDR